ncbi:putative amidophosphoribosyltransferase [Granulicella aggregans]|uniref:Putative amidophosphoribosyltransferase n=1 Tax=Granulicella aggregans TaxID=474949 RepID=A0A7W8E3L6_9BACT|nr:putative amidophosphoribosyltransferase [Granulicella aggregans]
MLYVHEVECPKCGLLTHFWRNECPQCLSRLRDTETADASRTEQPSKFLASLYERMVVERPGHFSR